MTKQHQVSQQLLDQTQRLLRRLNTSCLNRQQINQLLAEIFGYQVDESDRFLLPFYCNYGRNIRLGKHLLVGCNVLMTDKAGITIGDHVVIGSGSSLITVDGEQVGPIKVEDHVTVGSNVLILPGVHIGAGATICAGTVVTHNLAAGEKISRNSKGASQND